MKKIMISQPMDGKEAFQVREERLNIIDKLEKDGWTIVNSIVSIQIFKDASVDIYNLSRAIRIMSRVDNIYFMKGWEHSKNCKIEHEVAICYGKNIYYEEE